MLKAAETGQSLSKQAFKEAEAEIHHSLLNLQRQLRKSERSLIILVSGVEGAGKGEVVDALNRWLDTRTVRTHAYWDETDDAKQRPRFWRYWRTLPARGMVSIMFGSWYANPITSFAMDEVGAEDFQSALQGICNLEQSLTNDGTIIIKLWFHLTKEQQEQRHYLDTPIRKFKKSPMMSAYTASYEKLVEVSNEAIAATDSTMSPWHIIDASDHYHRDYSAGSIVVSRLQSALSQELEFNAATARTANLTNRTVQLDSVDLSRVLAKNEYKQQLEQAQLRLHKLTWAMFHLNKSAVLVFEGWDAAGKGSAIRRLTTAIDARLYRVIPIAAPSDEELKYHYMWRFWRSLPRAGFMHIYDRSWYGRVLVERIEGFAELVEWQRAYDEINQFEEHLTNHGVAVMKFWIHISHEEQLNRFEARADDRLKHHKITAEDWRNREQRHAYETAVNDMVAQTNTENAPWNLISGENKRFARVQVINHVCDRLEMLLNS
jgi:polyphosphate:AMP phosphotransferase